MKPVEHLLARYKEELAHLEDQKARGDLTKDWGECSLIHVSRFMRELIEVVGQQDAIDTTSSNRVKP